MEGKANMKDLLELDLNVLPHVIASIGKSLSNYKHRLIYQLFRSWPLLCDVKSNSKVAGGKRKKSSDEVLGQAGKRG